MVDALARVTGRVGYTIDLELPGMLHAKLLRSVAAHARIARIDASRARRLPGVVAVVTGEDLAGRSDLFPWFGPIFRDQPIVAIDKVRFVGEPVAAVAAVDLDTAQEALGLIEVEYEELPAVFTLDEALAEDAPLLHEGPPRLGQTFPDVIVNPEGGNVCNHFKLRKGDVDAGFAQADHVFEDVFTSPATQHVPLETHACVAAVADGQITVWAGTQIPFVVRSQLAEIFKLPLSRVRVIVPTLGGGYGAKCYPKIEPVAALLASVARRPVKLHLTREEEFVTITKHAMRIRMRTGLLRDGTIVARQSTCHFNTGAYADIGPRLIKNGGYGTGGPHAIPNLRVDSYAVYTNLPPAGAFRGYGINQAAWAYETQMDMIAERIGMDPYELRMRNFLNDGDTVMTGEPMTDSHFHELLDSVSSKIGWDFRGWDAEPERRGSKVRAKGLSCIIKGTVTPSTSTASARLNDDGSLDVLTSAVEMGQGLKTALAILAGERLSLPVRMVAVSEPDTAVTPYDQQTSSSRSSFSMGGAVTIAVEDVRRQLLEHAAELLEVAVEDLELEDGTVRVAGAPDRAIGYGQVIQRSRAGNLLGSGTFQDPGRPGPRDRPGDRQRPLAPGGRRRRGRGGPGDRPGGAAPLPRGRVRRQDHQPGPGRAADRGERRLRGRPGAVRGDGLRPRPAPERQPRRLHDRQHQGHAGPARPDHPGAPGADRDPRDRRDQPAAGHAGDRQRRLPGHRRARHRPADHPGEGPAGPARAPRAGDARRGRRRRHRCAVTAPPASNGQPLQARAVDDEGRLVLTLRVNGQQHRVRARTHHTLLEVLRDQLRLVGTREGCGVGMCGACTVLVDGNPVSSCLLLAALCEGRELVTVEGLQADDGGLDPVQEAFVDHTAFQCSYCTPGFLLAAKALLAEAPDPSAEEVKEYLAGNLCRCGSYVKILDAVLDAKQRLSQQP